MAKLKGVLLMKYTTIASFSLAVACAHFSSVGALPAALVAQYDFEGNVNDTTAARESWAKHAKPAIKKPKTSWDLRMTEGPF